MLQEWMFNTEQLNSKVSVYADSSEEALEKLVDLVSELNQRPVDILDTGHSACRGYVWVRYKRQGGST